MNSLIHLYRYSLLYPRRVVVIAALLTLAITPGVFRLTLRADGYALVPASAPEVLFDRSIRDELAIEDPIVISLRSNHPDGIFNTHTLTLIQTLSEAFQKIEGIHPADISSLSTERVDRVLPGTFQFQSFLDPMPVTPADMNRLRSDLEAVRLHNGTLVSFDQTMAAIFVGIPRTKSRVEMYRSLEDIVAVQGSVPEEIHVIGAPVAEALLGNHILEDLGVPESIVGRRVGKAGEAPASGGSKSLEVIRSFIARHVGLVPIAIAIMALVFLASFRSFAATFLALIKIGACLLLVFGLMGWFGVPVYLTTAVMPVMLVAIGVSDEIHIFSRYARELRERRDKTPKAALGTTLDELWEPVVKTSVTTAIGFLSFAISPLPAVRAFGIFTGIGTLLCVAWALTVTPALAVLINPKRFATPEQLRAGRGEFLFRRLADRILRHRRGVIATFAVLVVASLFGARRVEVQDSWIDGFAPASEFYQATQRFNEHFLGAHFLLVSVGATDEPQSGEIPESSVSHMELTIPAGEAGDPQRLINRRVTLHRPGKGKQIFESSVEKAVRDGDTITITLPRGSSPRVVLNVSAGERLRYDLSPQPLNRPEVLEQISALEEFIRTRRQYAVGGVLGPASYLTTTSFLVQARREGSRVLPPSAERIKDLWGHYQRIRGEGRLRQVINPEASRGIVTVFLKDANFVSTGHLMDELRDYERTELQPRGISIGFAGDVAVSQTLIKGIVDTQVQSLLLSIAGVILVTAFMARSLRVGLYTAIPCSVAVLVNFALMGWIGVPLGVATSMFASMTVGIGDDYAIHLLDRYRFECALGLEPAAAIARAVTIAGQAILTNALAVILGFGILILSQVPANARLGACVTMSIFGCMIGTLILLPALLRMWRPRHTGAASPAKVE